MSRLHLRFTSQRRSTGTPSRGRCHHVGLISGRALSLLLVLALLSGVLAFLPRTSLGQPDSWTFMVYMNGDNDLERFGIEDFLEMSSAGSSPDVNIVVQFDRYPGQDFSYDNWITAKRFLVTKGMTPTIDNALTDIGEVNMGDPATLTAFIDWAVKTYATTHYVLDIWDHGSNWAGISWDYSSGSYMNMSELDTALAGAVALNPGLNLDIIAFDACAMGSIEVAYQVMPYARYLVASEINVPNPGFEYGDPLTALVANPNMTAPEFGDQILGHYYDYYESLAGTPRWFYLNGSFALSVIDLQLVGQLASSVDGLSLLLTSGMEYWVNHVKAARNATEDYEVGGVADVVDLHHLAENLAAMIPNATIDSKAAVVIADVEAAVLNETHGTNPLNSTVPVNHTNGISIYFQPPGQPYDAGYSSSRMGFVNNTAWDETASLYDAEWPLGYPTVMNFGPTGTSVLLGTPIEVWFSEPVDNASFFAAYSISPAPSGPQGYVVTNFTYYSIPETLDPGTTYTVTITVNLTDAGGVHMKRNFTWQFKTQPEVIPEFPSVLTPVLLFLAIALVAVWRGRPGKAFRK